VWIEKVKDYARGEGERGERGERIRNVKHAPVFDFLFWRITF
jgi:hypothetical protein